MDEVVGVAGGISKDGRKLLLFLVHYYLHFQKSFWPLNWPKRGWMPGSTVHLNMQKTSSNPSVEQA